MSPIEQRRIEYLKLLRQAPAITEVAWLDREGLEQLRVSRLAMDQVGGTRSFGGDPRFTVPQKGGTYFGPVYFRKETEPYMTIARAARAAASAAPDDYGEALVVSNRAGQEVLTSHAPISTLGWNVITEVWLEEAFAPLIAELYRAGILLLIGLLLSAIASVLLARRMVRPIRALQDGAAQIGAGDLDQRIDVHTGDELETLADQFNGMAARLKESYAGLERKVEERTRELTEALEQQTATAETLKVISSSPTDLKPVFDALLENATRLCDAHMGNLALFDGDTRRIVAQRGGSAEYAKWITDRGPFRSVAGGFATRMVAERRPIQIADLKDSSGYRERTSPGVVAQVELGGARSCIVVPMLKEGRVVGGINIYRPEVRPFSLVNDILDLSKIEAGRMELELSDFDLPAALENAVKFTAEGGSVAVAARPFDAAVEISVADTGMGIAPEDHEAVFEEFRQVGRDYTRKAGGTGLGLALTRRFVERHGGSIRLQSAPGKGSTFTFSLPIRHG